VTDYLSIDPQDIDYDIEGLRTRKLKYLPVPRNSIVAVYSAADDPSISENPEQFQAFVEQLIVASGHNDFLVVEIVEGSDIDVISRNEIEAWLDSKTRRP